MKSHGISEAWARTTSVDIAAALSVLGIPIEADQSTDTISGRGWKTLLLGMESVPYEAIGGSALPGDPLPTHRTKAILGMLQNGALLKADPHHPSLDVLRGCKALEALTLAATTGTTYRLARSAGTNRCQLVAGDEADQVAFGAILFRTANIKLAAALCVLGCPLIRVEGSAGVHRFVLRNDGYPLGGPPAVAADLVQAWRSGSLAKEVPEHPLLWILQGLQNREAIVEFLRTQKRTMIMRAPGTGRASLVQEDASLRTLDRVKRHLRIP